MYGNYVKCKEPLTLGGGPFCKDANLSLHWSHAQDQQANFNSPTQPLAPGPEDPLHLLSPHMCNILTDRN
jgi:hypothetical protein